MSAPRVAGDPVRVLLEVDLRDRDELAVERDREVLVECLAEAAVELSALGDRRVTVWNFEPPLPLKPNVTSGCRPNRSTAGVRDVLPEQRDVVLEDVELGARVGERVTGWAGAHVRGLHDDRAGRNDELLALPAAHPGGKPATADPCAASSGPAAADSERRAPAPCPDPWPRSRMRRCRARRTCSTRCPAARCPGSPARGCFEASFTAS